MSADATRKYNYFILMAGAFVLACFVLVVTPAECKNFSGMKGASSVQPGPSSDPMMETVCFVLEHYKLDNGTYPTTEQGLQALVTKPIKPPFPAHWKGPYLGYLPVSADGRLYEYAYPGVHNTSGYDLSLSNVAASLISAKTGKDHQSGHKKNFLKR